jgi:2-hydroxy-3-keto-5-methylthiopentenyl-1-phosphate phosphatase
MRVYCDFDGTISTVDTTDHVLDHLAHSAWRELEADWVAGRIDAAACMRAQIALIGGSDADLDRLLDGVLLDPGFVDFAAWCARRTIPITVVSDGVDYFIYRILKRHGLSHLPVISNHLAGQPGGRRLEQPFRRTGCASGGGVCKCDATQSQVRASPGRVVYVGDGRSDFCVSGRADILFAKGDLSTYAASINRGHFVFQTFQDVTEQLDTLFADRLAAS